MANRLITFKEAAEMFQKFLGKLTPAEQAVVVYEMQTNAGGFPRDLEQEKRLYAALEAEGTAEGTAEGPCV
jgi:hypothetical protein